MSLVVEVVEDIQKPEVVHEMRIGKQPVESIRPVVAATSFFDEMSSILAFTDDLELIVPVDAISLVSFAAVVFPIGECEVALRNE